MRNNDVIATKLELIAAKSKLLANDVRNNKLWPGDLSRGMGEISRELNDIVQEARDGDASDH